MGIPLLVSIIQGERERLHRVENERQEIASDDGKIRVIVPATWTKLPELNKQASLQVGNKSKEVYLIVITEAKADVPDLTLEKHHQLTRDRMLQKISATEPVSVTIDGHPALQDELTGTERAPTLSSFTRLWTTATISNKSSPWTLKSRWQKQNQLLREVTTSFRSEK